MIKYSQGAVYSFWQYFYYIVIGAFVIYLLFWAINSVGLSIKTGMATVVRKEYKNARTSYQNTYIQVGGRLQVMVRPIEVPEMYIINVKLAGRETSYVTTKEKYEALKEESVLEVKYVKKRLTGGLKITEGL